MLIMTSGDVNAFRGQKAAKNATLQWIQDFMTENSTEGQLNLTHWTNDTFWEPEVVDSDSYLSKAVGALMMIFGIPSNAVVLLVTLVRMCRETKTGSIHLYLCSLSAADMLVCSLFLPAQAGWIDTNAWAYGDALCKAFAFFRIFGRYMSSFIVACIAFDRFYAAFFPFQGQEAMKRAKVLTVSTWTATCILSLGEAAQHNVVVYASSVDPDECAFMSLLSERAAVGYTAIRDLLLHGLPFSFIMTCYACISWKMWRNDRRVQPGHFGVRHVLNRTKKQTIKLSIMIIVAFLVCWIPYFVMVIWFWVHLESALTVDQQIWRGISIFACFSSCVNPVLYGYRALRRN